MLVTAAVAGVVAPANPVAAENPAAGSGVFHLEADAACAGLSRLSCGADARAPNLLRHGGGLGTVELRVRTADGPWRRAHTAVSQDVLSLDVDSASRSVDIRCAGPSRNPDGVRDVAIQESFRTDGDVLRWSIRVRNTGPTALEIGDLALPLPMSTEFTKDPSENFRRRFHRHQFIAGEASFLFWQPVGGLGPILVMLPEPGTGLEYFVQDRTDYAVGGGMFKVFIHSAATGAETAGTWRYKHTGTTLAAGAEAEWGFTFHWAENLDAVRDVLHRHGGFDVWVVPGMVVPEDLTALVAVRTKHRITGAEAEFPGQTLVEPAPAHAPETAAFRVRFGRLGENRITVRCDDGRTLPLDFFVTQPLETLIKKRAAFIATRQQHRDPTKWYDGLFSLWDVRLPEGRNLLGPDNLNGQHPYAVGGSDDPSNSKAMYLAEKNVAWPDASEIDAIEYYLEHFVWGKLQRTDEERPYPYGIYGSDNWHVNRAATRDPLEAGVSRPGGPSACRMWRTFDYTTLFAVYFDMYRIATQHPGLVRSRTAAEYLDRAAGTARAYFEVPAAIRMEGGWAFTGWPDWAWVLGNFHEKYLLGIIDALEREGRRDEAAWLRGEWEKKVKYFIYDDPHPWTSEMPVDSTAFETTYAVAKYAIRENLRPDDRLWQDRNTGRWFSHPAIDPARHRDFLRRQAAANLACRGSIEPAYWTLGSDFRACGQAFYMLSYMSQMGGWSLLDQGLHFEDAPAPLIRLGYASLLSSWALVNAGTPASNHGCWYPGPLHDGAVGWGFTPQKSAGEWNAGVGLRTRGAWPVDGEIDHGLAAAVEAACTVVLDDPIFGLIALGGELVRRPDGGIEVSPRDGVRQRLHVLRGDRRIHLSLDRDGFAAGASVRFSADLARIDLDLENRAGTDHATVITLAGLVPGTYGVATGGRLWTVKAEGATVRVSVPMSSRGGSRVVVEKR